MLNLYPWKMLAINIYLLFKVKINLFFKQRIFTFNKSFHHNMMVLHEFMAKTAILYWPLPRWQMSTFPTSMGKCLCIMPSPHQTKLCPHHFELQGKCLYLRSCWEYSFCACLLWCCYSNEEKPILQQYIFVVLAWYCVW